MNKAAFLVEGHLEQKFVRQTCPKSIVRRINCNGKNASMSAIARRIATQCRLLGGRNYPIIVIFDREDRTVSVDELRDELLKEIANNEVTDSIVIGIPDRTIENWILADREIIMRHSKRRGKIPLNAEGLHGKRIMGKQIENYHETTLGVDLLTKCRASELNRNSNSFSHFFKQLDSINCWWLKR